MNGFDRILQNIRECLSKLPAILQRSMSVAQARLQTVIPKLKNAMEEVLREAKLPAKS